MVDVNQTPKFLIIRSSLIYVFEIIKSVVNTNNIGVGILTLIVSIGSIYIDRTFFREKPGVTSEAVRPAYKATAPVETVDVSEVVSECGRYKAGFAKLYEGYPIETCDINVYRLPEPDKSFVSYMEGKRDALTQELGPEGGQIVRNFSMSAAAYDRMFNDKYFRAIIEKDTTTFSSYYNPIVLACKTVGVDIKRQKCPFY